MSSYTLVNPQKILIEISQSIENIDNNINYIPKNIIWIAPKSSSLENSGSGTQYNPYKVETPDEFDGIFKKYYNLPTLFKLYPGKYYTKGSWNFPEQNYVAFTSDSSIEGNSSNDTFICLSPSASFQTEGNIREDTNVFWIGNPYRNNNNMSVKHLTFDGNYSLFRNNQYVGGLRIHGNNCYVEDVIVKGIRGSKEKDLEVFGISTINYTSGSWQGNDGGTTILNCIVKDVATGSYVSAFSMGYRKCGRPITPSYILNCKSFSGTGNHFGYAACCQTTIRDCYAEGVNYGVYNDTDDATDWNIESNTFVCHYAGAAILSTQPTMDKSNVRIKNNVFNFKPITPDKAMIGITLEDFTIPAQTPYSKYIVEGNIYNIPMGIPNPFVFVSIKAPKLKVLRLMNNTIPSSSLQNIIDTPNKEVKLLNNWDHNGELILGSLNKL